jgi:hypothetical protein
MTKPGDVTNLRRLFAAFKEDLSAMGDANWYGGGSMTTYSRSRAHGNGFGV